MGEWLAARVRDAWKGRPGGRRWGAMAVAVVLVAALVPTLFTPSGAEVTITPLSGSAVNKCQGALPTPGSENTEKELIGGTLVPGGTAVFRITYPVDEKDVGRETFVILDCVFIEGDPVQAYEISFVPNEQVFVFSFTLQIPPDAPLGGTYCNVAKTTAAPSESQASNRKAGPACFIIGGDGQVIKVDQNGAPLLGASFTVVCVPTADAPPVIIEGVARTSYTGPTGDDNVISISGPDGTECTVTEIAAPDGYVFSTAPRTLVLRSSTLTTIAFVNTLTGDLVISKTSTGGVGTFTFNVDCTGADYDQTVTITTAAAGAAVTQTITGIPVGTVCTVTEVDHPQFTTTAVVPANGTVTVDADGETVAFTNQRDTGGLTITKTSVGGVGTFTFDVDCEPDDSFDRLGANAVTITTTLKDVPVSYTIPGIPTGNVCIVTEVGDSDWVTVVVPANGTVTIDADGETVAFTNTRKGEVDLVKTSLGQPHAGVKFQIRTGASETSAGTVVASGTTDANGYTNFGGVKLPPGDYQLCEIDMLPGWSNNLAGFTPLGGTPEGGDNGDECVNFTLLPGEFERFSVTNTPPPGGDARTIGYWKNHASCKASKGNQRPVLDETLAGLPVVSGQTTNGVYVGDLYVDTCAEAVALLDKSSLDGKKRANDAAYALAAQLLAAQLNYEAEAEQCAAATTAIAQGQALLDAKNFDGTGSWLATSSAQRTEALQLAASLDSYNNNTLC